MSTGIITLIVILFAAVFVMGFVILDLKAKYNGAKQAYFDKSEQYARLRRDVRRLLWNIGNQREKVRDNLIFLSELHGLHGYNETKVMVKKVMENIK
jgi:hypothetical protein